MYGLDERLTIARVSLFNFSDGVRFESGLTVIDGPEFDYLRCSNKPIRRTEIKVRGIYPEDKVTIHFTIFAYINACFYFFVLKCINLHEETELSLSNNKNAKRLKEIRF